MGSSPADKVARDLRDESVELDDIARARMERELLAAVRANKRASKWSPSRGFALGVAVTLAAAGIFLWMRRSPSANVETFALAFESRRDGNVVEQGSIRAGGTVHTDENETARVHVRETQLDLGAHSSLRIVEVNEHDLRVVLAEGHMSVAFHPRERGRDRLSIETPNARVEVVGTVFSVTLESDGATRVRVQEGVVRVTEVRHEATLVHAGNEVRVGGAPSPQLSNTRPRVDVQAAERSATTIEPVTELAPTARPGVAEGPRFAESLERIEAMLGEGKVAEARAELERMSRSAAPIAIRATAWNQLGDIDQGARRYSQAAIEYEHAASLGAVDAFWSLARVRDRYLHDTDGAQPAYENYLRAAPRGAEASLARARLCELGVSEHCSPLSAGTRAGTVGE